MDNWVKPLKIYISFENPNPNKDDYYMKLHEGTNTVHAPGDSPTMFEDSPARKIKFWDRFWYISVFSKTPCVWSIICYFANQKAINFKKERRKLNPLIALSPPRSNSTEDSVDYK